MISGMNCAPIRWGSGVSYWMWAIVSSKKWSTITPGWTDWGKYREYWWVQWVILRITWYFRFSLKVFWGFSHSPSIQSPWSIIFPTIHFLKIKIPHEIPPRSHPIVGLTHNKCSNYYHATIFNLLYFRREPMQIYFVPQHDQIRALWLPHRQAHGRRTRSHRRSPLGCSVQDHRWVSRFPNPQSQTQVWWRLLSLSGWPGLDRTAINFIVFLNATGSCWFHPCTGIIYLLLFLAARWVVGTCLQP